MHLPSASDIDRLPLYCDEKPLRILVSACLAGQNCGVDGTSYGEVSAVRRLLSLPNVKAVGFCPEDFAFGTPRRMPDIHGGNGFDVLDGKARVLADNGEDWTSGMVRAAHKMLEVARREQIDLAVLMDMSAACGSQVISYGCRLVPQEQRVYQKGPGVAAALLMRNGFRVISQRDDRTLERLRFKLDPSIPFNPLAMDHHEGEWYRRYFKGDQPDA